MVDLNKLSPAALKAAMTGGTEGWGQWASSSHVRYKEPIRSDFTRRQRCRCCGKPETHAGMANGIALAHGCEKRIDQWVETGR